MAAALACSKILKELAKEEEDTDTTDEMLALAEQYEHKAIGEWEEHQQPRTLSRPVMQDASEGWWVRWMMESRGDAHLMLQSSPWCSSC